MILSLIIPVFLIAVFVTAIIKKVKVYDSFIMGAKKAIPLVVSLFPYVFSVLMLAELFKCSGLFALFNKLLSPVFHLFGIDERLSEIIILKPFSGGGALALLSDIYTEYGVDNYVGICASCIYGSSETVFYVASTYFSSIKGKSAVGAIIISLVATFFSIVFTCFICRLI